MLLIASQVEQEIIFFVHLFLSEEQKERIVRYVYSLGVTEMTLLRSLLSIAHTAHTAHSLRTAHTMTG